eukprot:5884962-Pyramimonas_sp.AAC.1
MLYSVMVTSTCGNASQCDARSHTHTHIARNAIERSLELPAKRRTQQKHQIRTMLNSSQLNASTWSRTQRC